MSITLTESAARRVQSYLDGQTQVQGLRLGVKKTGCSGWAYVVDLTNEITPDDEVFEDHGVKVIVKKDNLDFLDGTELDFRKDGLGEVFKFNNPNVKAECGCGESFSV